MLTEILEVLHSEMPSTIFQFFNVENLKPISSSQLQPGLSGDRGFGRETHLTDYIMVDVMLTASSRHVTGGEWMNPPHDDEVSPNEESFQRWSKYH